MSMTYLATPPPPQKKKKTSGKLKKINFFSLFFHKVCNGKKSTFIRHTLLFELLVHNGSTCAEEHHQWKINYCSRGGSRGEAEGPQGSPHPNQVYWIIMMDNGTNIGKYVHRTTACYLCSSLIHKFLKHLHVVLKISSCAAATIFHKLHVLSQLTSTARCSASISIRYCLKLAVLPSATHIYLTLL